MGAVDTVEPDLQLADGCLVDHWSVSTWPRLVGLGDLLDSDHVATTLRTVHRRNFRATFTTTSTTCAASSSATRRRC